jgi:hypothetical protein
MTREQRDRLAASMGIVAVILVVLSLIFGPGEPPGFDDSADEVASFVSDNSGALEAVTALTMLTGVALVWFLGSLARTLRTAEGADGGRLTATAFAGGILAFAFAGVGTAMQWVPTYHDGLDAPLVQALWDAGNILFMFSAGAGFVIVIGASSVVVLTAGGLPRSLGLYGAVLAIYSLVVAFVTPFAEGGAFSPSNGWLPFVGFVGFLVWILWTSIALIRQAGGRTASAAA